MDGSGDGLQNREVNMAARHRAMLENVARMNRGFQGDFQVWPPRPPQPRFPEEGNGIENQVREVNNPIHGKSNFSVLTTRLGYEIVAFFIAMWGCVLSMLAIKLYLYKVDLSFYNYFEQNGGYEFTISLILIRLFQQHCDKDYRYVLTYFTRRFRNKIFYKYTPTILSLILYGFCYNRLTTAFHSRNTNPKMNEVELIFHTMYSMVLIFYLTYRNIKTCLNHTRKMGLSTTDSYIHSTQKYSFISILTLLINYWDQLFYPRVYNRYSFFYWSSRPYSPLKLVKNVILDDTGNFCWEVHRIFVLHTFLFIWWNKYVTHPRMGFLTNRGRLAIQNFLKLFQELAWIVCSFDGLIKNYFNTTKNRLERDRDFGNSIMYTILVTFVIIL